MPCTPHLFKNIEDTEGRFLGGNDFSADVDNNCRLFVVNYGNLHQYPLLFAAIIQQMLW